MKIPFLNLYSINKPFHPEFKVALDSLLESGWYLNGKNCSRFEKEFSDYCGVEHCVGVANGLDGLKLVLMAWKEQGFIKPGDEVILPSNTFVATVLAVSQVGMVPVFAEPSLCSNNLSLESIQEVVSSKTKVIIPVHLYGRLCPMLEIMEYARKEGMLVLEDSAQAHGASINGQKAGSFGDAGSFSFYPGKNLGALGDAGAITTNNTRLAKLIRAIANYGSDKKYVHNYKGINSRLDEVQAAFLSIKLKNLHYEIANRQKIADLYLQSITNEHIEIPEAPKNNLEHVWHLFVITTKYRNALKDHLANCGIETIIHYPTPPHKQAAYMEYSQISLPIAEMLSNRVLSIPNSHVLTAGEQEYIINSINSFVP